MPVDRDAIGVFRLRSPTGSWLLECAFVKVMLAMLRSRPGGPGGLEHICHPGLVSVDSSPGMIAIVRYVFARKQFPHFAPMERSFG